MEIDLMVLAGGVSTIIFAGSVMPMIVKAVQTRDLASYSLGNLLLSNMGNLVHSVYIYSLPAGPIWALHAFYLVTTGFMLAMYLRHEALGRKRSQGSTPAPAGTLQDSPESGPSSEFQQSPQVGSNSP
ncbi:hypothetical protein [Arthrobacter sp. VKM Ac-2550]|uniref:hypothetical protein n=1 Tax=Crystallibacter permensis TaxID=1938888 RepID=UPI0022278703|nr:hypothetical protein [Arthrobacter sp. VKM Ac-2550]MCW2131937.1 hypothetical protein [Arthrobacter sp. VKM Ac-2550]